MVLSEHHLEQLSPELYGHFSGNVTGVAATFTGNVSVGGTLTYEDVTNIDSVGIITARTGIKGLAGGIACCWCMLQLLVLLW